MRVALVLATIASWARPASGFASMPTGQTTEHLARALVAAALTDCSGAEQDLLEPGLEMAADALVEEADADSNGILSVEELNSIWHASMEETQAVADLVVTELRSGSGKCLAVVIFEKIPADPASPTRRENLIAMMITASLTDLLDPNECDGLNNLPGHGDRMSLCFYSGKAPNGLRALPMESTGWQTQLGLEKNGKDALPSAF